MIVGLGRMLVNEAVCRQWVTLFGHPFRKERQIDYIDCKPQGSCDLRKRDVYLSTVH